MTSVQPIERGLDLTQNHSQPFSVGSGRELVCVETPEKQMCYKFNDLSPLAEEVLCLDCP